MDYDEMTASEIKDAAEELYDLQAPLADAARELRRAMRDIDMQELNRRTA